MKTAMLHAANTTRIPKPPRAKASDNEAGTGNGACMLMGLTCSCDHEPEPGMVWWEGGTDFTTLDTARAKRCCSCNKRIAPGDTCVKVVRGKIPEHDVEINIYGEDGLVPRADAFLCEECGGLMFSLEDLGFCPTPWENQLELVAEYADLYGRHDE